MAKLLGEPFGSSVAVSVPHIFTVASTLESRAPIWVQVSAAPAMQVQCSLSTVPVLLSMTNGVQRWLRESQSS